MDHQIGIYRYVFVGNAFIRSEMSVNIHGPLDGNGFLFLTFFHSTYPNKNVTEVECINAFPTQKSSFYDSSNPGGE